jgi:hypothetical protein
MKDPKPVPESLRLAHLYLLAASDADTHAKRRTQYRDVIKPWIMDNTEPDEDGNYFYEFPDPVNVDGNWYKGLMAQRRASELVNEERTRELINKYDLIDRCIRVVTVSEVDYDESYAANQEGIIPDEEIDSIIEIEESYALVKVKN